jgi:GT2 family glycosyltransferase
MAPPVEIVIVNWKGYAKTRACLSALAASTYPNLHITVVDNESDKSEASRLHSDFPAITLHKLTQNTGFTGGNNYVLKNARDDTLYFLLNDDTLPPADLVDTLVATLEANPSCAAVGPFVLNADGTPQSAGMRVNLWTGSTPCLAQRPMTSPYPVDALSGCAMLVRGSVVREVGCLDPDYFMYYEETDWCIRMKRAGYSILVTPVTKVIHTGGGSQASKSARHEYQLSRNRFRFVRKLGSRPQFATTILYVFGFYLWARSAQLMLSRQYALINPLWLGAVRGVLSK